jgi:glycosyltransferase involved in cell wall biosynthesis
LAALATRLWAPGVRVVWGVRVAALVPGGYDRFSRATYRLTGVVARLANLIVCNSQASLEQHLRLGYPRNKMVIVDNGVDTQRFQPNPHGASSVRREWGIGAAERLVGMVARIDAQKDHDTFLRAAALAIAQRSDLRVAVVGGGPAGQLERLTRLADELGIGERVVWAGWRDDLPAVYGALDVHCLSSQAESFPNSVAEAMACATPCVATDVGEVARIVDTCGIVVSPGQAGRMAEALLQLVGRLEAGEGLGEAARRRIVELFGLDRMVVETERVLLGP